MVCGTWLMGGAWVEEEVGIVAVDVLAIVVAVVVIVVAGVMVIWGGLLGRSLGAVTRLLWWVFGGGSVGVVGRDGFGSLAGCFGKVTEKSVEL
jgi:hypothetical protein